jgi:hypothetical protein
MASYLVEAGTSLYRMTAAGVATQITLPSNTPAVSLYGTQAAPLRTAVFTSGNTPIEVCVNGGSQDFFIDTYGVARRLQLTPPTAAPVLAIGAGTGLTGIYTVAMTFKIKDVNGNTIIESALGPLSTPTSSLANKSIGMTLIPVSGDPTVNARGIYRSTAGGSVLYPWFDIDNNTDLTDDRAGADALLSIISTTAYRQSAPPDLKLIATWNDQLWGVPRKQPDHVRWTDPRLFYAWSPDNEVLAPPTNTDGIGVTALIPRRDNLGIAKRKRLYMITGSGNDSFQRVGNSETLGCVSQESVVVHQNIAYMLGENSVNAWSDEGIVSITDDNVQAWFTTDKYFNRSMFPYAQGRYNPDSNSYELLLSAPGSSNLDRWISYSIRTQRWYGPHLTNGFIPSCAGTGTGNRGVLNESANPPITVFGGQDGRIYQRDGSNVNDGSTAVPLSIVLPPLSVNEPDLDKIFLKPTIHTRAEASGVLTVIPTVGSLEDAASIARTHDLRLGREVLPMLGRGRYCQLTLTHSATTERPRIMGIEIPYNFLGRR